MTTGDISFLIIALAILGLVLFIGYFLVHLSATLNSVTQDVKLIANDVDDLLINTNVLLKDVNGKMVTVDPVFQAAGDLGASVSELNTSAHEVKDKFGSKKNKNSSMMGKAAEMAFSMQRSRRKQKKNKPEVKA